MSIKRLYKLHKARGIKFLILVLLLLVGGYSSLSYLTSRPAADSHDHSADAKYTCPMHPNIIGKKDDRCPICGMDLVAITTSAVASESDAIHISNAERRMAGIETLTIKAEKVSRTLNAIGTIDFDETSQSTLASYATGRVEKLIASYTGYHVKKGAPLAILYSPELYAAQVEYLQSVKTEEMWKNKDQGLLPDQTLELVKNARTKLAELGFTERQFTRLVNTQKPQNRIEIFAPIGGTVIKKSVVEGQYVKKGEPLFEIASLSKVWLVFDLFPEEADGLLPGLEVHARVASKPGEVFMGTVSFIEPVVSAKTRTVKVRAAIANPSGSLRPGDYIEARIAIPIEGILDLDVDDESIFGASVWQCADFPEITAAAPAACPVDGSPMVEVIRESPSQALPDKERVISIPRDALIKVGIHSIVFVESSPNHFELRRVETGAIFDDKAIITKGLKVGETIAAKGVFLIDSQMQLSGKLSILNIGKEKEKVSAPDPHAEHNH